MYTLKEYSEAELPAPEEAIEQGALLLGKVEKNWDFAKKFEAVSTYTHWENGDYWAARVSEHNAKYSDLLSTLYENHTAYEAEYIGMIQSQKALDPSASGAYSSNVITYKFPAPLNNRDMAIWSTKRETVPGEQFVVVTLPRRIETQHTKGLYVAVEKVTKLSDDIVKWEMATTSDAGGWLPKFVQRPQLPAAIAEDIPQYFKWLDTWRKKQTPS